MTTPVATREIANLGPLAQLRAGRLARRVPQLIVGLVAYGVSLAMMVVGAVGLAPWDVLHSGLTRYLPLTLGQTVVLISFVVLLLWIPLKEQPGIGTIANAVLVGLSADAALAVLPTAEHLWARVALMVGGVLLCGVASALYIGSQFGRGPRDGLMTGLMRRTGLSLRLVRTGLEGTVVVLGFALGGVVGLGTLLYAVTIGPLTQGLLPFVVVELKERNES
ncbi:membrane protein YczE [Nocardioides limicola]|uniref:membrane protein YczE n=1 Tax=Nocardioides limicola TaxID=2803368 RepID=UPI00193C7D7F|nr:hypothetical protein [Nocardioides sp. DJM-14]